MGSGKDSMTPKKPENKTFVTIWSRPNNILSVSSSRSRQSLRPRKAARSTVERPWQSCILWNII